MAEDRAKNRLQRRLAAILNADVVGYSRLMAADEPGTLMRLKGIRSEIVDPAITAHGGRLFKEMGDGLLVDFASAVDAVTCAVAIQRSVAEREGEVSEDRRIRYRVGINLGDIVVDGSDIFGDGVNVAARLQALAEPDGIRISAAVYDQIRGKLQIACEDLGDHAIKNIARPVRIYRVLTAVSSDAAALWSAEQAYRQLLKTRYGDEAAYYIPLSGHAAGGQKEEQRTRAPRSTRRSERRARVHLNELVQVGEDLKQVKVDDLREAVEKYPCVILLGDPGCGKSTTIEALAFDYANHVERMPLLLHLSEFVADMSVEDFIRRGWGGSPKAGHWGAETLAAKLGHYLEAGKLLLLFDALNEMPQEGYRSRCGSLREFIDKWSGKGNRFVVTCRSLDYGEELSGLQRVEVQPLNDDQIRKFLENELPGKWHSFWKALQFDGGQQRLLELARNPYLLTVMIDVFDEDEELSPNRAELMRRFTEIMLEWAKARCLAEKWLDPELQVGALSVMAFEMQARAGFGTKVKLEQIKTVMPESVQLDPKWPPIPTPADQVLDLAASANIIEMPVDRQTVRFYHQLLQEYFAARQMLKRDPAALADFWRVPLLAEDMPSWPRPENNYEPLPPPPPTGWEQTTILAAAMAEKADAFLRTVATVNPVLAGRCLLQGQAGSDANMRLTVVDALLAIIANPDADLRARIAAGTLLGDLGDPRIGEMVTIPAGQFLMGEGREQHALSLPAFRIGKFPVTNFEYRRFVEAGGYSERSYWTDAGWVEVGEQQKTPRFWKDARFNRPNQPVMGLSWYECVAFCRWMTRDTGMLWRLPTEAEWEKAARGTEGYLFPWGNAYDPARLNGRGPRDRQACTPTPVGLYPAGVGPFGLFDCVGNVWEWCATRWKKPFPYDSAQDEWHPDYLQGQNLRVLRGGSWYDTQDVTRCAHRFRFQPFGWNDRGGFRLVSPV